MNQKIVFSDAGVAGARFAGQAADMTQANGILSEMWTLAQRARQVWPFVAIEDRLTLGAATVLMGITSAANTLVALQLGRLVDQIEVGTTKSFTARQMYVRLGGF